MIFCSKDTVQTLRSDKFAIIKLFHTTDLFQYPLKTSQGVSKETSGMKWVNRSSNFQQELFKRLSTH